VTDASKPLTIYLTYYDLDSVIDIGDLMGEFEMDFVTHFDCLHMYSFQRAIIPSDEYILEAMVENHPLTCVSSKWKP